MGASRLAAAQSALFFAALLFAALLSAAGLFTAGCARVDPDPSLCKVRGLGEDRYPHAVTWVRTDADQADVDARVKAFLAGGITRDGAVRIAVLNSPVVQAQLAELGVATADLVEAGLPQNPSLDFIVAFPTNAGNSGGSLVGWLSDLWILPRRKRVAQMGARQAEFQVALDIMMVAQEAARTWDRVVVVRQELLLSRKFLVARDATHKRRLIRFAHGVDNEALVQEAATMLAEQQNAVRMVEQALTEARTQLGYILAVTNAAGQVADGVSLPPIEGPDLSLEAALALALERRLDLAIAQAEIERRCRIVGLERALVWNAVAVGAGYEGNFERVSGGDNTLGPVVYIELPIFNQNQAGKAASNYQLRQAVARFEEAQLMAAKEVFDRYQAFQRTRASLETLEKQKLPAADAKLKYVKEWHGKMQLPYLDVLEAQMGLLDAQAEAVHTRKMLHEHLRMLHLAVHGG